MSMSIDEVKALDLAEFVSRHAGQSVKQSRGLLFFYSPFREERTPSFAVNTGSNTWADYGTSDGKGDIYDFVCYLHKGCRVRDKRDWQEAHEIITGQSFANPLPKQKDTPRPEFAKTSAAADKRLNIEHVESCAAQADPFAIDYFLGRHISAETVERMRIGTDLERPYAYEFLNGDVEFFHTRRYIMPYMTGKQVRKLAERRDDVSARLQIHSLQEQKPVLFKRILGDIAQRSQAKFTADNIPQDMLMDCLFGRKYLRPGAGNWVYNAERVVRIENGEMLLHKGRPILNPLDYLLISEGEINALTAEDAGYPAVAAKFGFPLAARRVYIVADNDANGAGQDYARKTAEKFQFAQIIQPPAGFNDMNDLEMAGKLDDWLASYGIYPQWERRFRSEENAA